MALKTMTAAALQHGHRRRFRQQAMIPLGKRSSQLAARFMAEKRIRHEQRKIKKQQLQQQKPQEQQEKQEQKERQSQQDQSTSITSSAMATPESTTPPAQHQSTLTGSDNKQSLQHILGRNLDDKDRSAADILATLYQTGLLDRETPAASERSASGTATPVDGDDMQPSVVALPSMQQTEVMLEVWWSEGSKKAASSAVGVDKVDSMADEQHATSSPMTPALSASSSASARSSFSVDSPAKEDYHHYSAYNRQTSPSGPPPPPYDQWRKSIAVADSTALASAVLAAPKALPLAQPQPRASSVQQHQSPFSTYEQNYFCSSRQSQSKNGQEATGPNGMPSPPQSPTDAGRPSEYSYSSSKPTLPTLPPLSSTLPTPPQSFSASMQSQQPAAYQSHTAYSPSSASAYQSRFHHQFELPAPMPTVHRRSIVNEDIATTVLTLPGLGASPSSGREPLTPVSPLTLPSAFGRRSTMPAMPSMASMMNSHYHNSHHDLSPRMAAKLDARRGRMSASAASSSAPASGKKTSMPKPHCNVKYETAELDFIMYQRTTKNRAWDDVTASFNAALPRLRQYADMDYARLGGAPGASSPDGKAGLDRYRARPERTTPGLQASYYRQRLALPLLNENGLLVFDDATNKQLFTEVMVRDDKSRKKMRRMTSSASLTAAGPIASSSSSVPATAVGGKGVNPDDTRVHLVLYFPERVTYYDYWFVSEEDKALARQRTYERNKQRHQRGLPSWHPGNDDPDSGILTRSKD
ncbi:hypothetical protein SCUCBS95973_009195 [Sporothrix curviconia]|uniref:Uncharacterized protein n=1 Tax=Sporothrix curviconia TaxID=1260050 RepID=A0ABP0CLL8_9PEZI